MTQAQAGSDKLHLFPQAVHTSPLTPCLSRTARPHLGCLLTGSTPPTHMPRRAHGHDKRWVTAGTVRPRQLLKCHVSASIFGPYLDDVAGLGTLYYMLQYHLIYVILKVVCTSTTSTPAS